VAGSIEASLSGVAAVANLYQLLHLPSQIITPVSLWTAIEKTLLVGREHRRSLVSAPNTRA
jgi:hypothetical protein